MSKRFFGWRVLKLGRRNNEIKKDKTPKFKAGDWTELEGMTGGIAVEAVGMRNRIISFIKHSCVNICDKAI